MIELTEADRTKLDRAEFEQWVRASTGVFFSPGAQSSDFYYHIWSEGKRAGIAAGLERAAKVCDQAAVEYDHDGRCDVSEQAMSVAAESCAAAIRAIKEKT